MQNWLTKKNVCIFSGIFSTLIFIWDYIGNFQLCGGRDWGDCVTTMASVEILFFPILPLFIFSLITYKLRDEIFQAWIIFAKWWIPLTIVLVFLAPATDGSLLPLDKGRVSLFMNALFLVISLLIIGLKSLALRKKE